MKCRRAGIQLAAYIYGELGGIRKNRLEKHLRSCASCSREVERLRETVGMLPEEVIEYPAGPEWDGFAERTLGRALAAERLISAERSALRLALSPRLLVPALAAGLIAVVALILIKGEGIRPEGRPQETAVAVETAPIAPEEGEIEEGGFLALVEQDERSAEALFSEFDTLAKEIDEIVSPAVAGGGVS